MSCQKQNSGFDLTNKEILKTQLQKFINDINEGKTSQFQDSTINWWNGNSIGKTAGKVNTIPKNISLNCIKQLNNLKIDSIQISGDTIFGLVYKEDYTCDYNDTIKCSQKNNINLVLSKKNKVKDIINQWIISICCFYMDESEITSNEYRYEIKTSSPIPTKQESDSINNYYHIHRNDYELSENCK